MSQVCSQKSMINLVQAARDMRRDAAREQMTILCVAERAKSGAENWFADSIAHVVPVYRQAGAAFERIEPGRDIGTPPQALYINPRDYETYMRWARSMQ